VALKTTQETEMMTNSFRVLNDVTDRPHFRTTGNRKGRSPERLARLRSRWPEVAILEVDVDSRRVEGRPRRRVTAYLHLGALLPVDVAVFVTRGTDGVPENARWPLFSVSTLCNGNYRYEGDLPARADDTDGEWTVYATPAAEMSADFSPCIARSALPSR
jgi:hypothetical protein